MKTQILKLDAPYHVIYAGGYVGRHIATLVTWKENEEGDLIDSQSYPVLDLGEEYPAGKLVPVDVEDCRSLCPPKGTNLYWVAKIIEYDFQQEIPAGADYILERMKLLDCFIKMPVREDKDGNEVQIYDYKATLDVMCLKGFSDEPGCIYRVRSNRYEGFYFESEGTADEVYNDLSMQLHTYLHHFHDEVFTIRFQTGDGQLLNVTNRLNADQRIEGFTYGNDTF